jgi:membrane protein DedA with SNARE-associated domain
MMAAHFKETALGLAGCSTTGVSFFVGWITSDAIPVLHGLSLFIGCLAGAATFLYYVAMWLRTRRLEHMAEAKRAKTRQARKARQRG